MISKSTRKCSVFSFSINPAPGTQAVIRPGLQPSPAPPPPPPMDPRSGSNMVNLANAFVAETVAQNQTDLRVWFRENVDARFSLADSMISYLSRMLDVTNYTRVDLLDLRLTVYYDPKDHENYPGDRQPLLYHVLNSGGGQT